MSGDIICCTRAHCTCLQLLTSVQGDSGGPLYTLTGDKAVLIGVVNRGEGCARHDSVGLYAR